MQTDTGALILATLLLFAALFSALLQCGCRSTAPAAYWPVPHLIDPVTEEVPHVTID